MQTVLPRAWSQVTVPISYEGNHYTIKASRYYTHTHTHTHTHIYIYVCVCVCVYVCILLKSRLVSSFMYIQTIYTHVHIYMHTNAYIWVFLKSFRTNQKENNNFLDHFLSYERVTIYKLTNELNCLINMKIIHVSDFYVIFEPRTFQKSMFTSDLFRWI